MGIRLLFLSDTHLGYDDTFHPRVNRRRRGPDFFSNYYRALDPALEGRVDCVVHGGDLLYRSKVPLQLVEKAFEPLVKIARSGIPVIIVPGNHERSVIPSSLFTQHANLHIFHAPKTYLLHVGDIQLGMVGFPFIRKNIRYTFKEVLNQTDWTRITAEVKLLCLHQSIEGASVGPGNYVFRHGHDVVKSTDIPVGFAAVLCGHIHRFQVLLQALEGTYLPCPILFSGSTERTSFAERFESKGYVTLDIEKEKGTHAYLQNWQFHRLPTRRMIQADLQVGEMHADIVKRELMQLLERVPGDSILKITIYGRPSADAYHFFKAESIRSMAPDMNVRIRWTDGSAAK